MNQHETEAMIYIQTLTERVNSHSKQLADGLERLAGKLDDIKHDLSLIKEKRAEDKIELYNAINQVRDTSLRDIGQVRDIALRDNQKVNSKVALLTGIIGVVSGGAGSLLTQTIKNIMSGQ